MGFQDYQQILLPDLHYKDLSILVHCMWLAQSRGWQGWLCGEAYCWRPLLREFQRPMGSRQAHAFWELKNWLPFNKTYLWTESIQILSCTGINSLHWCTLILLLMYTYILDWEFFSEREISQLFKTKRSMTAVLSDLKTQWSEWLNLLPSWSCDQ